MQRSFTLKALAAATALAGLTAVPGVVIDAPRVAEAVAQLECTVSHSMHVGREDGGNLLVFGEIVAFHVAADALDGTRVDQQRLHPVGRHAGNWYSDATDLFELIRPA
jgi:flavin reductase (DIM6/NTAB) family NADH-FMN oxidoreductase RutF